MGLAVPGGPCWAASRRPATAQPVRAAPVPPWLAASSAASAGAHRAAGRWRSLPAPGAAGRRPPRRRPPAPSPRPRPAAGHATGAAFTQRHQMQNVASREQRSATRPGAGAACVAAHTPVGLQAEGIKGRGPGRGAAEAGARAMQVHLQRSCKAAWRVVRCARQGAPAASRRTWRASRRCPRRAATGRRGGPAAPAAPARTGGCAPGRRPPGAPRQSPPGAPPARSQVY